MELIPPVLAFILLVGCILRKKGDIYLIVPLFFIILFGMSNYIDLLRLGYVRDPFVIGSLMFNVADIGIVLSTIWAIWVYTRR